MTDVSKPYLNAVERAIDLHFRSLEYGNVRLASSLDRSEKLMHQRIWKMKAGVRQGARQLEWKTRSDLEAHLGALAMQVRQRGGGRIFSKEKHSYFDQDTDTHAAASVSHSVNDEDEDGGQLSGHNTDSARYHRRRSSASFRFADSEDLIDADSNGDNASDDEQFGDYSATVTEKTSSLATARFLHNARASKELTDNTHTNSGSDSMLSPSALSSKHHGRNEESKSMLDDSRYTSPLLGPVSEPGGSRGSSRPVSHQTQRSMSSRSSTITLMHRSPTRPSTASMLSLSLSQPAPPPQPQPKPNPSLLQRLIHDRELNERASELVSSIRFNHEESMRRLQYTGGRELARRSSTTNQSKNLFAGVKDKFHTTFGALADLDDEEQNIPTATTPARSLRPSTTASLATARPILPSSTNKQLVRPSTSSAARSRLQHANDNKVRSRMPAAFDRPQTVDTFINLAPIIHLPRDPSSPSVTLVHQPSKEGWSPRASITLPPPAIPMAAAVVDTATVAVAVSEPSGDAKTERADSGELALPASAAASPPRPQSVYSQQRHHHLRAHFIHFLAATEPQLWTSEETKEPEREREPSLGSKNIGMRPTAIIRL